MYIEKQMRDAATINNTFNVCQDANFKKFKQLLIYNLFTMRYCERCNDIPLIQTLINDGYVTREKIIECCKQKKIALQIKVPQVLGNLLNAVTDVLVSNNIVERKINKYFESIYCSNCKNQKEYNKWLTKNDKLFSNGKLKGSQIYFVAYALLISDPERFSDVKMNCLKSGAINQTDFIAELELTQVISDYVDYDFVKNPKILNKYVEARKKEIFTYLCDSVDANADLILPESINGAICMAACGLIHDYGQFDDYVDLKISGFAKKCHFEDLWNPISKDRILPMHRTSYSAQMEILISLLPSDYDGLFKLDGMLAKMFFSDESIMEQIIYNSILSHLVNKLSWYSSTKKEKAYKEQLIRMFKYTESDICCVIETIYSSSLILLICNHIRRSCIATIENTDYSTLLSSIPLPKNVTEGRAEKNAINKIDSASSWGPKTNFQDKEYCNIINDAKELRAENEKLLKEIEALKKKIDKHTNKNNIINELKNTIEELREANSSAYDVIEQYKSKNQEKTSQEITDNQENEIVIKDDIDYAPVISKMKFIIVGGRWEINRELQELCPNTKVIYNKTDSKINVKRYDFVVFFTDYCTHGIYSWYINQCRIHNVPTLYIQGSNMAKIKKALFTMSSPDS